MDKKKLFEGKFSLLMQEKNGLIREEDLYDFFLFFYDYANRTRSNRVRQRARLSILFMVDGVRNTITR